ncbi:glycoside hydrolase superfamily [Blyttiomyces helicus]|uniref:mannan endo-1,4-beta-mannosidase n=1 Tax=Blyttiomyces helicus TaxID=388810 RepID=A0A4P9W4F1_9FUNG|nr:glycoside hydrolase superfamily [Blyttiomyces helicus]|eukprot:RKO87074.1 glycoside hydrolase superfamily [Blyttiomyces helicus]
MGKTSSKLQGPDDGELPITEFVRRHGDQLFEGDRPFRFISVNVPNLLLIEDRPDRWKGGDGRWALPDPYEQYDALLTVKGLHGRVVRTYTLGFGPFYHVEGIRTYNEPCFVAFDHALAIARSLGVRLIIPLLNNHNGGDAKRSFDYGSYAIMASWRGVKPSGFYSEPELLDDMRHLISFLLNRVNTLTGIRYGDDPTILGWELGNELGGWDGPAPPTAWTLALTSHLRSLAPKTLVFDGTMGGLNAPSRLDVAALRSPDGPDVFSNHYYYGGSDISRIKGDSAFAGKAFYIGEFGFSKLSTLTNVMETTRSLKRVSGALIWSLRFHSMDGGFYTHSEDHDFYAYHAPGFPESDGFHRDEAETIALLRKQALRIQERNPAQVPHPTPPTPLLLAPAAPGQLRWRGSAWAAEYDVRRGVASPQGFQWEEKLVAEHVLDNVKSGQPIWSDHEQREGAGYVYSVQAVGVDGHRSEWSNVVGAV